MEAGSDKKENGGANKGNAHDAEKGEKGAAVTIPRAEYEDLVAKSRARDDESDKYLRAHADLENLKKRLEKEKSEYLKFAKEEFVSEFMPVLDSLDMASRHMAGSHDGKAVREGFGMIEQQVRKFLKDLGVEKIKAVGEKFDPHVHEAIEVAEDSDKEEDTVVEELKAGYRLNGRLIRPAAVKIVKNQKPETSNQ